MKREAVFALSTALGLALGSLVLLVGLPMLAGAQEPMGTTFTYQGRLRQGGAYVEDAACDFQFSLYDAPTGGTQVGTTQTASGVAVRDGYFTVNLNTGNEFGASAFTGDKRYLQVAVRCGAETVYTPMSERIVLEAVPYALYAGQAISDTTVNWSDVISKPAGFADDVDNVVTYTNGFGLGLTGNQFSVITGEIISTIPDSVYQRRVISDCLGQQAIQTINADGSVSCGQAETTLTAGEGLLLTGTVFSIDETVVQRRVAGGCNSGSAIRRVSVTGTVTCEPIPQGDITEVVAGDGLAGGGTTGAVTLTVVSRGITTTMIAAGAVITDKIADDGVKGNDIAHDAVDTSKIKNGTIQLVDLAGNGCSEGQVMEWSGAGMWQCATDELTNYTAGPGLELNGSVLSASVEKGVKISAPSAEDVVLDFAGTGSSTQAARSDHSHGDDYVTLSRNLPTGTGKDVNGNYTGGFTVVGIRGQYLSTSIPSEGNILRYNGSQWQPYNYNFPLNLRDYIRIVSTSYQDDNGIGTAYCASDELATGGGCKCAGGDHVEVTRPYNFSPPTGWRCDCQNGSGATNVAYVICMKRTIQ